MFRVLGSPAQEQGRLGNGIPKSHVAAYWTWQQDAQVGRAVCEAGGTGMTCAQCSSERTRIHHTDGSITVTCKDCGHVTEEHYGYRARASRQGGQALPSTGAASRARLSLNDDKQTVCA